MELSERHILQNKPHSKFINDQGEKGKLLRLHFSMSNFKSDFKNYQKKTTNQLPKFQMNH